MRLKQVKPWMRWPWQKPKWGSEKGTELDRLMDHATVINAARLAPIDTLPFRPGDCPRCGNRCDCMWVIETATEGNEEVTFATWKLGVVACPICRKRADEWAHVEIERRLNQ